MGAGAVSVEDMASVHLSSSKHWHLSQLSTGGGHCFLLFTSLLPSSTGLNSARNLFSLPSFIYTSLFMLTFLSLIFFYPAHTHLHLTFPTPCRCPVLSVEQPIQQLNKAAYSITRRLIKRSQNAAALWLTPTVVWTVEPGDAGKRGPRAGAGTVTPESHEHC